jgi:pimeloyl-ACP methyl ester carboxylesterase
MTCRVVGLMGLLAATLALGCGDDEEESAVCVDASAVPVFPSPAWQSGAWLTPPDGDRAAAIIEASRPEWLAQLGRLDGWSRLPELVVPLSAASSTGNPDRIKVVVQVGAEWQAHSGAFDVAVAADPPSLILRPQAPFPPGADEVIVVVEQGAASDATALPVCGEDGAEHPDYAAAREQVAQADTDAVEVAFPLRLARTHTHLSDLGVALDQSPVLAVESIEARTLDSFGDLAPPTEVAAVLAPTAASGILALPDYRGSDGSFEIGGDGLPIVADTTRPGFVVALPATGSAPYPVVLFQHGGSQDKADFFQLAQPLAEAGFAFVAIDLPAHGDRADSGHGTDLDFFSFADPLWTRGNFRQAVADHLAVLTGMAALNEALEPVVGEASALDPDRAFYMGLSLGGVTGSMTFATAPELQAGALFVAGAGYSDIVTFGLFSILVFDLINLPPVESTLLLGTAQTLLDGADPGAYGQHGENRERPPRPALFMQAGDETIMTMSANDRLARAYGAQLALPSHHDVAGLAELSLPGADNFTWDGGADAATRVLVHNPMAEVTPSDRHGMLITLPYAQEMVAHCFATLLESGSCEVIDTGFASH